jgi:hypothetical protein
MTTLTRVLVCVAVAAGAAGCRQHENAPAAGTPQMIWRSVGTWSGRGSKQTESFTSDTGALRVRWEAKPAAGDSNDRTFRLTAHSAISGRVLQQVVDERGPGSGIDYVSQDPHVFYMAVESAGLDWQFTVEEGIAGEIVAGSPR